MTERDEDIAEAEREQDRLKTSRMETKRAKQVEILKHEKDRTDKAEKWKTERIEAMKERQVKFAEIEDSHEIKKESKKARRQVMVWIYFFLYCLIARWRNNWRFRKQLSLDQSRLSLKPMLRQEIFVATYARFFFKAMWCGNLHKGKPFGIHWTLRVIT